MYHDITHLKQKGYKVIQKSPWHFHVIGDQTYINVWPTARKYMIAFGGGASYYQNAGDLFGVVRNILGEPGVPKSRNPRWLIDRLQREYEAARTDVDREAERVWREGLKELSRQLSPTLPLAKAVDGSIMP